MDCNDERLETMLDEHNKLRRVAFRQAFIVVAPCLCIGVQLMDTVRWLALAMTMIAGAGICTYFARLSVLRLLHHAQFKTLELQDYYSAAITRLYKEFGHDAAEVMAKVPSGMMEDLKCSKPSGSTS